jgi:actin-related protein
MFQDLTSIVVDLGTSCSRIGYGGDDAPKLMPSSYVSQYTEQMAEEGKSPFNVGDKYLFNERQDNEITSIYRHKGEEGIELDYSLL